MAVSNEGAVCQGHILSMKYTRVCQISMVQYTGMGKGGIWHGGEGECGAVYI